MATRTAAQVTIVEQGQAAFGCNRHPGTLVQIGGHPAYEGAVVVRVGDTFREICGHCRGTGYRPGYVLDGGRCWPCRYTGLLAVVGRGTVGDLTRVLRRRATDQARRDRKRAEQRQAQEDAYAAWAATRPELIEVATWVAQKSGDGIETWGATLYELAAMACVRPLSDAQADLLTTLHAEAIAKRDAQALAVASRVWLGEVGQTITVTGTLTYARASENAYGWSTLYRVTTADGQSASWWRSGFHEPRRGAQVTLTGRVKQLNDSDRYGKDTQLTRCKIQIEEDAE